MQCSSCGGFCGGLCQRLDLKPLTRAEISKRQRDKAKQENKVQLYDKITVDQRDKFKSVLRGESKIVKLKKK